MALALLLAACTACTAPPGATPAPAGPAASGTAAAPSAGGAAGSPRATPSPEPAEDCATTTLAGLSRAERVGRLFMVGIPVEGVSEDVAEDLAERRVGALILMGTTEEGLDAVRAVVTAARERVGADVLVAVDQEGGQVRRLRGPGFAPMPSADVQASWSDARLRTQARRWGRELREVGVDVDLAPVADVVPASGGDANAPIGRLDRGYGSSPAEVSRKVTAFVAGMAAGGVQSTLKHFPGLGRVAGNTDFTGNVVDDATRRQDPSLAPFAAGVEAGAGWLMISSATYARIDPDRLAMFSAEVIEGMARRDLRFDGVVVSDDIGAAKALADVPPGRRALRFLRAGGDVALTVDAGLVPDMVDAVLERDAADPVFAREVDAKAERVLRAADAAGRLPCSR